jgi:uncharacterized protein (TIRG00374 family)
MSAGSGLPAYPQIRDGEPGEFESLAPKRVLHLERWALLAIIVFVAAFGAVAAHDEGGFVSKLRAVDAGTLLGLLGLSLVNFLLRATRWKLFADRLGVRVSWSESALYYFAGFAMTITPGKVGEFVRLWFLNRRHGYRIERTTPLVIGDWVGDALAILLLAAIGISAFTRLAWIAAVAGGAVVLGAILLLRPRLLIRAVGLVYGRVGRGRSLFIRIRTALRQFGKLGSPRTLALALLLGGLAWLAEAGAFYWVLSSMGQPLPILTTVFIFSFSMMVGVAILLPAGFGGMEGTMVALLLQTGMDLTPALAATALIRVATLWFAVAVGCLIMPAALRLSGGRAGR